MIPSHPTAAKSRLDPDEWQRRVEAHRSRARCWTEPTRARKARGQQHPVEDFLFTYYFVSLNQLEQWHPGFQVALVAQPGMPVWLRKPPYQIVGGVVQLDPRGPEGDSRMRLSWIHELLVATRDRPPNFGCHGLHEWAMVYTGHNIRHRQSCPLRLAQADIDALVESRPMACSHFDAFRFFHPQARPLNRLQPSLESRQALEQPGCVHANMDLYKWVGKSIPWVGSELLLDAFEQAMELRELDMRASPYDLREFGLEPVRIETASGREEYVRLQQALARKAAPLRDRLIETLEQLLAATS